MELKIYLIVCVLNCGSLEHLNHDAVGIAKVK